LIRIIAIGAPLGDDAVGLEVGRRLAAAPPPGCDVRVRERPGLALIDDLAGATSVLLIDAVQSGGRPGEIVDIDLRANDLRQASVNTSSHGIGVAEAIVLASALGKLPPGLRLLGIEVATPRGGGNFSPEVAASLDDLESRARAWAFAAKGAI
jgi:hydrogenase maturation protease